MNAARVQVTVEDLSPRQEDVGIALPEEVRAQIDARTVVCTQRARIKGFRPGRVAARSPREDFGDQVEQRRLGQLDPAIRSPRVGAISVARGRRVPRSCAEEVRPGEGAPLLARRSSIEPTFDVERLRGARRSSGPSPPVTDGDVDRADRAASAQSLAQLGPRGSRRRRAGRLVSIYVHRRVDGRRAPGCARPKAGSSRSGSGTFPAAVRASSSSG